MPENSHSHGPCGVSCGFKVRAETQWGDTVMVVGEHPRLGCWEPQKGLALTTSSTAYPVWTACLELALPLASLEYKLVICRADGCVEWEPIEGNRRLCLTCTGTVVAEWGKVERTLSDVGSVGAELCCELDVAACPCRESELRKGDPHGGLASSAHPDLVSQSSQSSQTSQSSQSQPSQSSHWASTAFPADVDPLDCCQPLWPIESHTASWSSLATLSSRNASCTGLMLLPSSQPGSRPRSKSPSTLSLSRSSTSLSHSMPSMSETEA